MIGKPAGEDVREARNDNIGYYMNKGGWSNPSAKYVIFYQPHDRWGPAILNAALGSHNYIDIDLCS